MSPISDPGFLLTILTQAVEREPGFWNWAFHWFSQEIVVAVIGLLLIIAFVTINAIGLIYAELKIAGHIQRRPATMEVGWHGFLQPVMDAAKLLVKEAMTPTAVNRPLFLAAPVIVFLPVLISFIVLPFSEKLIVRDLNLGLLLIFAFSALNVIGILIAGWASNNKYSLLGALRSVSQNIAYEIPILLSAMSVVVMANSLKMSELVAAQDKIWFFIIQPLAAIIFFVATTAETNRLPFDIPEAEGELVAGFHSEYSGMRFALFFLAEYSNMFIVSAVFVTLFLGGWHGPILPGLIWFLLKVYILVFIVIVARWTFPRLRFDQLMTLAWKVLIPLSLANLLVTALVIKLVR
ncbi:MAG: NADH-quinone oxidoreductase subunit NuoH [Deltaproteobacteria bacterium]|nr:NADH-quinone oxidoreductase subunit NuoH [Deltaproteobacteria bacterium]MBW2051400.1 NADH-quinone oxidoreductase subunit NuoH [Deltaproteobacteria bacterium]MBW2140036.1 NADH-quinone oxidoreductase subunit NuoH [Deltaproteobacteria bacterium]MBW2321915.1 NADH-quinone oxidoreductase subunit NuoH [Deltaproteobacteria bacterium]